MPQKSPLHTRSWGTRFDSLHMSPPLSPQTGRLFTQQESTLDRVQPTPPFSRKDDKVPHDASIFVGSLPAHIEQPDLTKCLYDHFADHNEVKNVKVIRDSKGGICAFVQCEDAAAAAKLLHTLHSTPPKLFMGRILRYEPARAFRTLLISYRTPFQFIPINSVGSNGSVTAIELDLPHAMRLWRHKNSKLYGISYNAEAVAAETDLPASQRHDKCLFLHPISFDGEAIRKLVTYFGPLERFIPYQTPGFSIEDSSHLWNLYPAPHNAERKAGMDTTCWEVKWNYRDDCVCALTTLRRVPHLTVTWAHQSSPGSPDSQKNYSPLFQHPGAVPYQVPLQLPSNSSPALFYSCDAPAQDDKRGPITYEDDVFSESKDGNEVITPVQQSDLKSPKIIWSDVDFPPLKESESGGGGQALEDQLSSTSFSVPESVTRLELDSDEPESDGSPHMPMTPTSLSPTSRARPVDVQEPSIDDQKSGNSSQCRKEVDPTTLFVGGLEVYGPNAWDKEKVEKYFARFDGLEEVKVVHPANSRSAFAFVRFNNTESPARAVLEEHNRVHEGRTMRVQLRDFNPSKSPWKHRGRGKYHYRPDDTYQSSLPSDAKADSGAESITCPEVEPSFATLVNTSEETNGRTISAQAETKPIAHQELVSDHILTNAAESSQSGTGDAHNSDDTGKSTTYHEWCNIAGGTGTHTSIPPVAPISNTVHVVPTYHVPAGYYPIPPYMQAYPYPMQLPLAYYNYPYPLPAHQVHQGYNNAMASEQTMVSPGPPWSTGVSPSYVSYSPSNTAPNTGLERVQGQASNGQAPLVPTGFLQNEQGTLIAVYQPEALDRYMASSQGGQTAHATLPLNQTQNSVGWAQYSQIPPYRSHGPSRPFIPPFSSVGSTGWIATATGGYVPMQPPLPDAGYSGLVNHNYLPRRANCRNSNRANTTMNRHPRGMITNGYPGSPKEPVRRPQLPQSNTVQWSNW